MIELLPVMAGIALSAVALWYLRCFARTTARVVREAHDIVSDFVYGSFRVANKAAGKYARNAIEESTRGPNGRSDNRSTGPGSR